MNVFRIVTTLIVAAQAGIVAVSSYCNAQSIMLPLWLNLVIVFAVGFLGIVVAAMPSWQDSPEAAKAVKHAVIKAQTERAIAKSLR